MAETRLSERQRELAEALEKIKAAWQERKPDSLAEMVAGDIAMVLPGFGGAVIGRDAFVAGFKDFCENAVVHAYRETAHQFQVSGNTGVATFLFDMVYERDAIRNRSTGRDLWVFEKREGQWLAVW